METAANDYLSLYSNFSAANKGIEKKVMITVDLDDLRNLKSNDYRLCIAKKVGNVYTVVWQSYDKYLNHNEFSWTPVYQLFASNLFQEGLQVKVSTNLVKIELGEIATLDEYGILNNAVTGGRETSINMKNNYGQIHPGINQLSTGLNGQMVSTPIYVAEKAMAPGIVELTPKEQVMVWFQQDIETGTMISSARSNYTEIDLTSVNMASVTYKGGKWQKG